MVPETRTAVIDAGWVRIGGRRTAFDRGGPQSLDSLAVIVRWDAMLDRGDLDGYAAWKRILRAVEELQGTVPESGEAVHRVAV